VAATLVASLTAIDGLATPQFWPTADGAGRQESRHEFGPPPGELEAARTDLRRGLVGQTLIEQFVDQMSRRMATEAADRCPHPGDEQFVIDGVEARHLATPYGRHALETLAALSQGLSKLRLRGYEPRRAGFRCNK
jgi:hypothetical protein